MSVIRIVFEGMIVLFVNNGRRHCNVGILKSAPGHMTRLIVNEISHGDPQEMARLEDDKLEPRLWLDVAKAPASLKIQLVTDGTPEFDRNRPPSNDFRWALDFEGLEMYKPDRINVDVSAFSSMLQINDGKFYTRQVSNNELKTKSSAAPERPIGKVATKLLAEITLAGSETATLWNGADVNQPLASFRAQAELDYGIYVGKTRHHHSISELADADAENYYTALASNIAPGRKLHFDVANRIDPDARCLIAWMSETELT